MRRQQVYHSGSIRVPPKALARVLRLLDKNKRNHLNPHQCGRKLEKRAAGLTDFAAPLTGAAVGGLAGAAIDSKNRNRGALIGAGLGGLGGMMSAGLASNSTPAASAGTDQANPSLGQVARSLGGWAKSNPVQAGGAAVAGAGLLRNIGNAGIWTTNRLPWAMNRFTRWKVPSIPAIPGGQMLAKAAPWATEAMNFSKDPLEGLANSKDRMSLAGFESPTSGGAVGRDAMRMLNHPAVFGPTGVAANTVADLAQGGRQAFAQGNGNPLKGYWNMSGDAMHRYDALPHKEPVTMGLSLGRNINQLQQADPSNFKKDMINGPASLALAPFGVEPGRTSGPVFRTANAYGPTSEQLAGAAGKLNEGLSRTHPGARDFFYEVQPSGRTMLRDNATQAAFSLNKGQFQRMVPANLQQPLLEKLRQQMPDFYAQMTGQQ